MPPPHLGGGLERETFQALRALSDLRWEDKCGSGLSGSVFGAAGKMGGDRWCSDGPSGEVSSAHPRRAGQFPGAPVTWLAGWVVVEAAVAQLAQVPWVLSSGRWSIATRLQEVRLQEVQHTIVRFVTMYRLLEEKKKKKKNPILFCIGMHPAKFHHRPILHCAQRSSLTETDRLIAMRAATWRPTVCRSFSFCGTPKARRGPLVPLCISTLMTSSSSTIVQFAPVVFPFSHLFQPGQWDQTRYLCLRSPPTSELRPLPRPLQLRIPCPTFHRFGRHARQAQRICTRGQEDGESGCGKTAARSGASTSSLLPDETHSLFIPMFICTSLLNGS